MSKSKKPWLRQADPSNVRESEKGRCSGIYRNGGFTVIINGKNLKEDMRA